MTDENQPAESVTPLGVVKLVLVLFIGLGALLVILGLFGLFAWVALWSVLLKLAAAGAVVIVAALIISWLMRSK